MLAASRGGGPTSRNCERGAPAPRGGGHRWYGAARQLFFLVPAERIHTLVFALLRGVTAVGWPRRLLRRLLAPTDPVLASTVFGCASRGR